MGARYSKGQQVEIISVTNEHLRAKYPEIEEYVGHHIQALPTAKPHNVFHIQTSPMQIRRECPSEGMRITG